MELVTKHLLLLITFMQGIYNYIPQTSLVSVAYSVAAILWLQFMAHVMLFRTPKVYCTFTAVLSAVGVQCPVWLFSVVPLFCVLSVCDSGIL